MTDALVWTEEANFDGMPSYEAKLPWAETFNSSYYFVYPWKDGWAFSRPEHRQLGKFDGVLPTAEAAQRFCQQDFAQVARLHRWDLYMRDNEPPLRLEESL